MKRTSILLAFVLGYALAGAAQNLVQNGSFELPVVTSTNYYEEFFVGTTPPKIPNWTVVTYSLENVLIITSKYKDNGCNFHAKFGNQWLDLTGAGSNTHTTGVMSQPFPTILGHVYQLSFWVENTTCHSQTSGTTSSVIASITPGPTFPPATNSNQNSTDLDWQQFSYTFTAGTGSSATVTFLNNDGPNDNINGIDNVVITDLTAAKCVQPPNTTMVAWYPFDELPPVTTSANLATANTGQQQNGPLGTSSGMVGPAALFNGFNQWVQSPDSIVTNFGPAHDNAYCSSSPDIREGNYSTCRGNFSIDAWIYVIDSGSSNGMTILSKYGGSNFLSSHGYGLFFDLSTQKLVLELADGVATDYFSSGPLPLLYQWNHIAVTVDRTSTTGITFYLNGGFAGNANPVARSGSLVSRGGPLSIGAAVFPFCCRNFFSGYLDELEIHNRVLTPQEILDIVNAGQYGKCKP